MELSVSNIAWDIAEEAAVADLLAARGVRKVDVAPGKYFEDPARASAAEIEAVRRWWADRGFQIIGLQALLFGTSGLNLFGDDGRMLERLGAICRVGGLLGAKALTFGSPRQRDRGDLDDAAALAEATAFFRRLGDAAAAQGVTVCLEPNPAMYGCNFMVRTAEAAAVVEAVAHPAIRLQLDVGALAANGEPPRETIEAVAHLIGHVHASEPGLVVLGDGGSPHAEAGAALRRALPGAPVTIEMAAAKDEPHLAAVARALDVAESAYGGVA